MSETTFDVSENEDFRENTPKDKGPMIGVRHLQIVLLFMGLLITIALKSYMAVVILAMIDSETSPNPHVQAFDWDNKNTILSSFLWGGVGIEFFAGYISRKVGPKRTILICMSVAGITTLLTPLISINLGSTGLIVSRVIQGFFMSFILSSMMSIMSRWLPKTERSFLGAFGLVGANLGGILGVLTAGYMAGSWMGWPLVFYFFGSLSVFWCILWLFFGSDSPEVDTRVSEVEKKYIMESLGQVQHAEKIPTPWKAIFTSLPFWALMAAAIGNSWLTTTFGMETPTYLKKAIGLGLQKTSLLSTIHSVIAPVVSIGSAIIADRLIRGNIMSTTAVRKMFHFMGVVISGVLCFALAFVQKEQRIAAVALITLAYALESLCVNSYGVNYLDLSPNFAGVMFGIINGTATALSILSPLLVDLIVDDETDIRQWRNIFITIALIVAVTGIIFLIFASGERQWWDNGPDGKNQTKDFEERVSMKKRSITENVA